jgi:hypothetical protein
VFDLSLFSSMSDSKLPILRLQKISIAANLISNL